MMDEDEAERIRASRGDYEVEFSCNGEVGLRQSKRKCDKNPGHLNFIPVKDFNIEHLPSRYRDNLLVDYVRATSDITCRLSVSRISGSRPVTYPDSKRPFPFSAFRGKKCGMTGTGRVKSVYNYTKEKNWDCECDECNKPGNTPREMWGKIVIETALHVVYDNEEARDTKCYFFYDSHETDINTVPTITGSEIEYMQSNFKGDSCQMICFTHDMELMDKLYEMVRRWEDLREKVNNKYSSYNSPDLCIIVSHPHGCSKVATVGAWTHRDVDKNDSYAFNEYFTYRYNTPTCPGSSGASVFILYKNISVNTICTLPVHSHGRPGNDNNSGKGEEILNI